MAQPHHKPAAGQKRGNSQKKQEPQDADHLPSFQKKGKEKKLCPYQVEPGSDEGDPVAEKTSPGKCSWKVNTRFGTGSTRKRPTKVEEGVLGSRRRRRSPENSVNPLGTDLTSAGRKLVYLNIRRKRRVLPVSTEGESGRPLKAELAGAQPQRTQKIEEDRAPVLLWVRNANREGVTELRTSNPKEEKKNVQLLSVGDTQEGAEEPSLLYVLRTWAEEAALSVTQNSGRGRKREQHREGQRRGKKGARTNSTPKSP
ncbi:hypothetical protein E2C01_051723 [Portunus trituberculatus]|uniref:Uncharacterized protein n=1 Tax=Portunus trituberculatus TaxID=210409 RepID=A0A5B7GJL8_PORTR|nr:hypothetical protein [Portunus trituberculatus]